LSLVRSLSSRHRYVLLSLPFLQRQRVWRKDGGVVVFEIRDGIDWYTAYEIFLLQDYSIRGLKRCNDIREFHSRLLAGGKRPLIIDCGGNIGLASRFFCLEFPNSAIISVEPNPGNVSVARKNNTGAVNVVCSAVGSSDGRGSIVDPGLGGNAYRMVDASDGRTEIRSINSLLASLAGESCVPFLVKIDIEGYESELFSKNVEWIDRFPVLMIELHDWMLPKQAASRNFLAEISRRNRDFVQVGGNIFSISNDLL
jgi:FkbM family methyltransferase